MRLDGSSSVLKKYFVVRKEKLVQLTAYHASLYELDGTKVEPEILEASWNTDAAMNGFPHFMMKEIHEQPEVLKRRFFRASQRSPGPLR